jgi:hypothetical protein
MVGHGDEPSRDHVLRDCVFAIAGREIGPIDLHAPVVEEAHQASQRDIAKRIASVSFVF